MVLLDEQFYIFPSYNSFPVWVEEWQQLVALAGACVYQREASWPTSVGTGDCTMEWSHVNYKSGHRLLGSINWEYKFTNGDMYKIMKRFGFFPSFKADFCYVWRTVDNYQPNLIIQIPKWCIAIIIRKKIWLYVFSFSLKLYKSFSFSKWVISKCPVNVTRWHENKQEKNKQTMCCFY